MNEEDRDRLLGDTCWAPILTGLAVVAICALVVGVFALILKVGA